MPGVGTIIVSRGPITSWTYDADGQATCEEDPLGGNTWTQYNTANLPVAITDALGAYAGDSAHTTMTEYDQMGDVTEVTDPLGRSVTDVYNSLGEKTEEIEPAVTVENDGGTSTVTGFYPTTYFGYDADGNVQYVTEPRGDSDVGGDGPGGGTFTTWYFYDGLDRKTCVVDAMAGADYLGASDATPLTQPNNSTLTTYDALGDVAAVVQYVGSSSQALQTTLYLYDFLGRKVEEIDPDPATNTTSRADKIRFQPHATLSCQ